MIARPGTTQSIVMWVVFNEGWGQYDTERARGAGRRLRTLAAW